MKEIQISGNTMDLSYSPDQKYLVSSDSNRKVGTTTPICQNTKKVHMYSLDTVKDTPSQDYYDLYS